MGNLENSIGKTCFIFGITVNSLGALSSFLMKDYACFSATLFCLIANILFYVVLFLKRGNPSAFVSIAMQLTGLFLFPFIMYTTEYPEQAILYQFILPVSFTLMKRSYPLYFCLGVNALMNFYKFHIKFPGTEILVTLIYLGVTFYISLMVKYYKVFFNKDYQELLRIKENYFKLARTDPLTGLRNRLGLEDMVDTNGKYFTIIIDIDHFKFYNDTYGHDQGDKILINLANILKIYCSDSFLVSRFGGEEFVIVATTSFPKTYKICESLRHFIELEGQVTISMGISSWRPFNEEAFKEADENLYKAKNTGRNKIVFPKEKV